MRHEMRPLLAHQSRQLDRGRQSAVVALVVVVAAVAVAY